MTGRKICSGKRCAGHRKQGLLLRDALSVLAADEMMRSGLNCTRTVSPPKVRVLVRTPASALKFLSAIGHKARCLSTKSSSIFIRLSILSFIRAGASPVSSPVSSSVSSRLGGSPGSCFRPLGITSPARTLSRRWRGGARRLADAIHLCKGCWRPLSPG